MLPHRMRSISELSSEANTYEFSNQVSFASWLHVCRTLFRESQVYEMEGVDLERAYILYLRYADLVLNKLHRHPGYSANKQAYNRVASHVARAIKQSELLKQKLKNRPSIPSHPDPIKDRELKLNMTKQATPESPTATLEAELEKYANDSIEVPEIDLESLAVHNDRTTHTVVPSRIGSNRIAPKIPEYPAMHAFLNRPHTPQLQSQMHPSYTDLRSQSTFQPGGSRSYSPTQDPVDPQQDSHTSTSPSVEFKSVYQTERGEPLRTVFVPAQLRSKFLSIASSNTQANLETCGMLCGKLRRNAFFVTDLVIPSQTSTSDSCATTDEEELFEYVDSRDLFIVGWIHTHPTQTCFMSSVDLHTHASYQLMLPEAIAIVCAPTSTPDWGAFRLTDPPGIDVIKKCKQTGFHQHTPNDNLYRAARPGGHYREIQYELVAKDLRKP